MLRIAGHKTPGMHRVPAHGIGLWVREERGSLVEGNSCLKGNNIAACSGHEVLKDSKIKRLVSVRLDPQNPQQRFLIKTYKYPGFWTKIRYLFRDSKSYKEWRLASQTEKLGVPTIVPLVIAERRPWGLLQESYTVAKRKENCENLEALLLEKRLDDLSLKRRIIYHYAQLAAKIHSQGVFQEDFDPNNVLLQWTNKDSFQLFLVDFERVKLRKKGLSVQERAYSLAKLHRRGRRVGSTDRLRFLVDYLNGSGNTKKGLRDWVDLIAEAEKKLLRRDGLRAARRSLVKSSKIGYLRQGPYRGYYRKRFQGEALYTKEDITKLLHGLEEMVQHTRRPAISLEGKMVEIDLGRGKEAFQLEAFYFSGVQYLISRLLRNTDLLKAWKAAHVALKLNTASSMPVAAVDKRISLSHHYGFLVKKPLSGKHRQEPRWINLGALRGQ